MSRRALQHEWMVAAVWLSLLVLLAAMLYRDMLLHVIDAWNKWDSGEFYAHGYLVLLISLFLVVRQHRALAAVMPCPDPAGLPVLAAASLLWLGGYLAGVYLVQVVALLPMLSGLLWVVLGPVLARRLFLPVFILLFALPVWSMLPELLQRLAADGAYQMSRLLGVPALQQGQLIILPYGRLHVSEECSGVSYLLAALTLGTLYGHLYRSGRAARVLVVAIAGAAALLANILRVLVVVYIGWRTEMRHPLIHDHFNLGWYLFGALVMVLLMIDVYLARRATGMVAGATVMPDAPAPDCARNPVLRHLLPALAGLALLSGPALGWLTEQNLRSLPLRVMELPAGTAGWEGPVPVRDDWAPHYRGASTRMAEYRGEAGRLVVFSAYYPRQEQGRELIYYGNDITGGDVWLKPADHAREVRTGARVVLEQRLYTRDGRCRLVWYWYHVAGHDVTSRFLAKFWQLVGLVTGRPQAGVIQLAADCETSVDVARERLGTFTKQMGPLLSGSLDGLAAEQED